MAIVLTINLIVTLVERLRQGETHWRLTLGTFGRKSNKGKFQ
jgi:hypothetical protein